jgi:enamine deaminase RidA (YjgF/YER057c/UK114 family)
VAAGSSRLDQRFGGGSLTIARRRVSSGGPWEARFGYSRAIVAGDSCFVSGTTDAGPDGRSANPGDPAAQARAIWGIVERALVEVGFALTDVVRTRMFVTDRNNIAPVAEVQGALLGEVRPASTALVVKGFIEPSLLVEIEVDAKRD